MILEQLAHGIVVIGEIPLGDKPPRPSPAGAKFLASQMRMQSMNPEPAGIASLPA